MGAATREAAYASRLVQELADVSQILKGTLNLRLEPVELSKTAADALHLARPLVDANEHELKCSLATEAIWVMGDAGRLEQMLLHLIANAVRFTPPGGQIWLTVRTEEAAGLIEIRDSGVGIPPEMLPHVFDPFVQVAPPARSREGLGVGLTLVKHIAEMHGGEVSARSEGLGSGAEFVVRLPRAA